MRTPHACFAPKSRPIRRSLLATLAAAAAAASPGAAMAQVGCGGTISGDATVVLRGDLDCAGSGAALTLIGPAVLDLGGFTVRCSAADGAAPPIGIAVRGTGAVVRRGGVSGCAVGVDVAGEGRHRVSGVTVRGATAAGIRVASDRNRIADSLAAGGEIGFAVFARDNVVSGNVAADNALGFRVTQRNFLARNAALGNESRGFSLSGDGSRLLANHASGSLVGFAVFGSGNRLVGNRGEDGVIAFFVDEAASGNFLDANLARRNRFVGISVGGDRNRLTRNLAEDNGGHGIRVAATASETMVRHSVARRNGLADAADDTPGCGSNRWQSNRAAVASQACIE